MYLSAINVILYLGLFLFARKKNKNRNAGSMVIPFMLLLTAVMCCYMVFVEPKMWKLTFFPFVYLFATYSILYIPVLQLCPLKDDYIVAKNPNLIKLLVIFFIVLSLSSGYFRVQEAISAFTSGDWLAIRTEMYQAEGPVYDSFFQRLSINGAGFLNTLGMVYFFYCLSSYRKKKNSVIFMTILFIAVFIPPIISAVSNAARGTLFHLGIKSLVVTLVFFNHFSKQVKKGIFTIGIVIALFFVFMSIVITLSRFDFDSSSSVLYYFGHSMNTFNYGVMDSIKTYSGGQWFLGDYYKLFGNMVDLENNGTHFGSGFITIIGCLVVDFGPYLTLLVILILVLLFFKKHQKAMDLSEIYLYVVYSELLIEGVFVVGLTYGTKLLVKLIIFYIIAFNYSTSKNNKTNLINSCK